jgi:hypothetical protein
MTPSDAPGNRWLWSGSFLSVVVLSLNGCGNLSMGGARRHVEAGADTKGAQTVYQQIRNAPEWIPDVEYGVAGELTNQVAHALAVLVNQKESRELLIGLLTEATPAGQLYALCGLYHVDRTAFRTEVERFRSNTNQVLAIEGDVKQRERICDVVFSPWDESPQAKKVILEEGQTLEMWMKEWIEKKGIQHYYLDISGGGYPSALLQTSP